MDESEVGALAKAVVAELGANVIPGVLPAEVGNWFREAFQYGTREYQLFTPLHGALGLTTVYRFQPDGSLLMELCDVNMQVFWRGTLRPVSDG